jgi:hypothetical protein
MNTQRTIFPEFDLTYSKCPQTLTPTQIISDQQAFSTQPGFCPGRLVLADMREVEESKLDAADMRMYADLLRHQSQTAESSTDAGIARIIMLAQSDLSYDVARQLQAAGQARGSLQVKIARDNPTLVMMLCASPKRAHVLLGEIFASEPGSSLMDWLGQAARLSRQGLGAT